MKHNRLISIVTIVTLLCLVAGAFSVMQNCVKIVKTGFELMILQDNAQFYNEQELKTDNMTEDYDQNDAKRQSIYNSEDIVIRVFSNLPILIKIAVWLLAIVGIPFTPFAVILYLVRRINIITRENKARRRMQKAKEERNLYEVPQVRRIV